MVRNLRRTKRDEIEAALTHTPAVPVLDEPTETPDQARPLGEMLVEAKLVKPKQVADALDRQAGSGKRVGELLVEAGAITERSVTVVVGAQRGLPVVDLRQAQAEPEALSRLPERVARATPALPLRVIDGLLEVAVSDPLDEMLTKPVTDAVAGAVRFVMAPSSDIRRAVERSYRALGDVDRHVTAFETTTTARRVQERDTGTLAAQAPVVQTVELIITQALRDRASDVHIEPQSDRLRIRYRIDGALHDVLTLPESMAAAVVSRIKILGGMDIVDRRRPQDGQFAMDIDGQPVDLRVSTTPTIWGEKAAVRILDRRRSVFRLHELGMSDEQHEIYSRLVHSPVGMVVCAGPTGSGKTTTLYATLNEINTVDRNITTIEDPVEYVFPSINQIQINPQAGVTFADGLRSILRQDPDVILIGEVRDPETAQIAVQSALTGHLVLSSLHAVDAASALHRFVDMGIESFRIASSVIGVVGQRLVRRICDHCRVKYKPPTEELDLYHQHYGPTTKRQFTKGEGCNFCAHTGYESRVGIFELLRVTDTIRESLLRKDSVGALRALAVEEGSRTILGESIRLVTEDVTTISEINRAIYAL